MIIFETLYLDGDSMHSRAWQADEIAQKAGVRTMALVHRLHGDPEIWHSEAVRYFTGDYSPRSLMINPYFLIKLKR